MNILNLLLVILSISLSCQKIVQTEPDEESTEEKSTVNRELLLQLINNYRTAGCNCGTEGIFSPTTTVKWNDTLAKAAEAHSTDMHRNNFFSHTGSDGSTMSDRIKNLGYNWKWCGENIAKGYQTEEQVVKGWINSAGHCSNIMFPNFQEIGVAKIGDCWTLVFGAR